MFWHFMNIFCLSLRSIGHKNSIEEKLLYLLYLATDLLFFISHRVNRGAAYAVFTTEEDALDGHIKCLEIKPKPIK